MTSATLGQSTSAVEVTNVSQHGIWLMLAISACFAVGHVTFRSTRMPRRQRSRAARPVPVSIAR
jgi:hypothetical protein